MGSRHGEGVKSLSEVIARQIDRKTKKQMALAIQKINK